MLNFHGSDDCYYEAIYEDISEEMGWMAFVNTLPHVEEEMVNTHIQYYAYLGANLSDVNWRRYKPKQILQLIEQYLNTHRNRLQY